VARIVNVAPVALFGVPVIVPVLGVRVAHAGRAPLTTEYVMGATPPLDVTDNV
jgi:hypothetical protein